MLLAFCISEKEEELGRKLDMRTMKPIVMIMITMPKVLLLVARARNDCNWFASASPCHIFLPSQGHHLTMVTRKAGPKGFFLAQIRKF